MNTALFQSASGWPSPIFLQGVAALPLSCTFWDKNVRTPAAQRWRPRGLVRMKLMSAALQLARWCVPCRAFKGDFWRCRWMRFPALSSSDRGFIITPNCSGALTLIWLWCSAETILDKRHSRSLHSAFTGALSILWVWYYTTACVSFSWSCTDFRFVVVFIVGAGGSVFYSHELSPTSLRLQTHMVWKQCPHLNFNLFLLFFEGIALQCVCSWLKWFLCRRDSLSLLCVTLWFSLHICNTSRPQRKIQRCFSGT